LSTIDATDEQAERASAATYLRATPIDSELREAGQGEFEQEIDEEPAEEERAARVRRRCDMLQQELKIVAMEQQLDVLRRARNAGYTPVASVGGDAGYENSNETRSAISCCLISAICMPLATISDLCAGQTRLLKEEPPAHGLKLFAKSRRR
jgi:hypothetical protein